MSGLGALPRSATSRESAQWSNIFTVMAGDYLLMRAHATVSHLGPRVGATMGDALARSYRRLMQTAGGPADVAIFHALTCRLAGIIAGVPDAVIDELASRIDGPATPPVPYCASSTATRCT